jgi:hypothetical protein
MVSRLGISFRSRAKPASYVLGDGLRVGYASAKHGISAPKPSAGDGWRHREMEEFILWASHYEDGTREGRSRKRHETWLQTRGCPVLRLDRTRPTADLVKEVLRHLGAVETEMANDQRSVARIDIRSADAADFDYCANLYFAGMAEVTRDLNLDPVVQRANLRQRWTADELKIILRDGADVGEVQSRLKGGFGTQVVKRISEEAGWTGKSVTLGVIKTNSALRFYERLGFRITYEDTIASSTCDTNRVLTQSFVERVHRRHPVIIGLNPTSALHLSVRIPDGCGGIDAGVDHRRERDGCRRHLKFSFQSAPS